MFKPYYQDDKYGITIYHGDCRDILPELEPVDLVLTDPPYNVGMEYESKSDWMTFEEYEKWCSEWFLLCESKRNKGGKVVIFPGHGNLDMWFRIKRPEGIGCWYKPGSPRHGGIFQWCEWEPFLVFDPTCKAIGGSDVIKSSLFNQKDTGNHPCPKPFPLFKNLISKIRAESILDPFMGSGTTLVAAKELGRKAIGIEIEEKYCEIAVRRLQQDVFQFGEAKCLAT